MKIKLNKKKIILCILLIIVFWIFPTFARYVYNNVRDVYLKSQNFSFSSNLLTTMGKTYRYANWGGLDNYEIDLQLYSYENELSLFTYEGDGLEYTLTCTVNDATKATAHIGSIADDNTDENYIPNLTNIKDVKIYLKPTENLEMGDTVSVTVTASTTEPYQKQISATFNVKVNGQNITYGIEDSSSSVYATLKLVNTKTTQNRIKLSFDPSKVIIDTTDECYENKVSQTYATVGTEQYVNSITFDMEPTDVKYIRFYKKDIIEDYTYPGGDAASMIVTVTEVN